MSTRQRVAQTVVIVLGLLMVGHFFLGFQLGIKLALAVEWPGSAVFILPYAGLTALFLLSSFLAVHHLRWGSILLLVAFLLTAAMCAYDLTHHRCQMQGGGIGESYVFWWWYYEPFWYGYKPGNV